MKASFSFKAKVIEPCGNFLSKFRITFHKPSVSLKSPTFRMPKRLNKPRGRTKTVRFRKPFSMKSLGFSQCRPKTKFRLKKRCRPAVSSKVKGAFRRSKRTKTAKKPVHKVRIAELLTVLFSLRKAKEVERESSDNAMADVTNMSVSEGGHGKEPFPSPITPAYLRHIAANMQDSSEDLKDSSDDLEDSSDDLEDSSDNLEDSSDNLEDVANACRSFENHMVEMIIEEGKLKDLKDVEELLYCWKNLKSPVFMELVCRFYGEICQDLFSPSEEDESNETPTSE